MLIVVSLIFIGLGIFMVLAVSIICIGLGMLMAPMLTPLPQTSQMPVFFDSFENYSRDRDIQKSYTVWKNGAVLEVSLQQSLLSSGKQSLRVEIISPNPNDQSVNGSIYHIIPGNKRNWLGGSGVRFWLDNPSDEKLLLSFNFKEEFNEYWAISDRGEYFFLQNSDGNLLQRQIEYGNLPIPAWYQGLVLVPFNCFLVPEWNTARGDRVMNLKRIESYAISVNIGNEFPRTFSIDDIEILPPTDFEVLEIQGASSIQIPASGEYREQYTIRHTSPANGISQPVSAIWSLRQPQDALIKIDNNGSLTVPAGALGESVTLTATYPSAEYIVTDEFIVTLTGGQSAIAQPPISNSVEAPYQPQKSAYELFSSNFEAWAVEYRPLFVVISIGVILLLLLLLSLFQRRLK
jgi:hypothetical protein